MMREITVERHGNLFQIYANTLGSNENVGQFARPEAEELHEKLSEALNKAD